MLTRREWRGVVAIVAAATLTAKAQPWLDTSQLARKIIFGK